MSSSTSAFNNIIHTTMNTAPQMNNTTQSRCGCASLGGCGPNFWRFAGGSFHYSGTFGIEDGRPFDPKLTCVSYSNCQRATTVIPGLNCNVDGCKANCRRIPSGDAFLEGLRPTFRCSFANCNLLRRQWQIFAPRCTYLFPVCGGNRKLLLSSKEVGHTWICSNAYTILRAK